MAKLGEVVENFSGFTLSVCHGRVGTMPGMPQGGPGRRSPDPSHYWRPPLALSTSICCHKEGCLQTTSNHARCAEHLYLFLYTIYYFNYYIVLFINYY